MKKTRADIDAKYQSQIKTPLVFGDPEQVKLLNAWRREVEEFEELERQRNDPDRPLLEYRVTYSYREEVEVTIEAFSEEDAEEKIREEYGDAEDFDIEDVELIKKKKEKQDGRSK